MKNKKFKKIYSILNLVVIVLLFFSQTGIAQAIDVGSVGNIMGVSSPAGFLDSIFDDLELDKEELKYDIQTFNSSSSKKTPPSVSLFFSPANPSEGEKITVTASPTYFLNDPKELYYTWFLKTEDCDRTNNITEENRKCDLDEDEDIDIEDYKIKATKIIANGGFVLPENYGELEKLYQSDSDDDGYDAYTGGNDQKGKNPYCYIHNIETGEEYRIKHCEEDDEEDVDFKDLHLFPNAPYRTTGNGEFDTIEEKFWNTDPNSNDTAGTGNSDEANVAGLGITNFTWNYQKGDEVGVAVEGVSTEPTQTDDSSYKTMWAISKGTYEVDTTYNENDYPETTTLSTDTDLNTPVLGQTTVTIKTKVEEIDTDEDGNEKIVNEIATIKTTYYTRVTITNDITGDIISDDTDPDESTTEDPNPAYSTANLAGEFDIEANDYEIEKPSDLNKLLYKALVSPQENSAGSNKLEINLSYSPSNPINDPTGEQSDILVIHSSIPNAKDNNYLQYKWSVYNSDEVNPDSWGNAMLKTDLPESTQSIGFGIDTFKFKLALENPKKYIRVALTATENVGETYSRKTSQDLIIPITSIDENEQISASIASITTADPSDTANLSGISLGLGTQICDVNATEKAVCPITKNQIIGLSYPKNTSSTTAQDFLWTIDGKPFSYPYCYFDGCDSTHPEMQTNTAFFPVLKEVGEKYMITLTTVDADKNGKKINLTKTFKVVEPKIEIISADESCAIGDKNCRREVIGKYFDVDGTSFPDYSRNKFWAIVGSNVKLKAIASFPVSPEEYIWTVDGTSINYYNASDYGFSIDDTGALILPPKEKQGENYNISASALYTQDPLVKKALKNIWNITYNQFYEKPVSDNIIVNMYNEEAVTTTQKSVKKVFASVFSSAPAYIAFLLRVVLTIFILLFTVNLIFSFSPKINSKED
ncbi:MAG TPA: hypothetical protein P5232_02380 [Candidatus Moranbacteria bacterium]|nr:hypothetical protein [Candidatus Moranbacteria bacterium]